MQKSNCNCLMNNYYFRQKPKCSTHKDNCPKCGGIKRTEDNSHKHNLDDIFSKKP